MTARNTIVTEQIHSPYYLRMVTSMGDTKPIFSTRDIYAMSGIKLLGSGAPVNSDVYEKLLHHKLVPQLDECLATGDPVTGKELSEAAFSLLHTDQHLRILTEVMQDSGLLSEVLASIPLNPTMAFKLTVMRDQRPDIYEHSIFVAILAIYLGACHQLPLRDLVKLGTAALLHDIGILHIDPALLERSHRMDYQERHHLYAHPLTAWMILNEYPTYAGEIARAVVEHHERLDGSGYPRGLSGDQVGLLGQIIAVAEIVAGRHVRDDSQLNSLRIETILKLNSRRYGRDLVGHLRVFYSDATDVPILSEDKKQNMRHRLYAISAIFAAWDTTYREFHDSNFCHFINEHIHALQMEILDAGVNLQTVETNILCMEDSPRAAAEASVLIDEIIWRLRQLPEIVRRRWPAVEEQSAAYQAVMSWMADVERLISATSCAAS